MVIPATVFMMAISVAAIGAAIMTRLSATIFPMAIDGCIAVMKAAMAIDTITDATVIMTAGITDITANIKLV